MSITSRVEAARAALRDDEAKGQKNRAELAARDAASRARHEALRKRIDALHSESPAEEIDACIKAVARGGNLQHASLTILPDIARKCRLTKSFVKELAEEYCQDTR